MLWICQNNLGSTEDVQKIQRACEDYGYDFMGVRVIPFSDELPDVPSDVPVVFYGATNWIQKIHRSGRWTPGTFLNEESVCSLWIEKYGARCVNWGCLRSTPDDPFLLGDSDLVDTARPFSRDECVFVRPDRDNKAFSGQVMTLEELGDWKSGMTGDLAEIGNEPVIIAPPVRIDVEWRLFIVDGKVVSGSQYRQNGLLDVGFECPREVFSLAEECAEIYSPAPVFVLDACMIADELVPRVLEIGCFNSAGFYVSDIDAIIRSISEYCISKYRKNEALRHRVISPGC